METFNIHITFSNNDSFVERNKNMEELTSALRRLHHGPAALGGLIKEVRVVDSGDFTVFHSIEWKVRFPKEPSPC